MKPDIVGLSRESDFLSAPGIRGKTLITTRLRPRAVEAPGDALSEGRRETELNRERPADAVAFFQAQGVQDADVDLFLAETALSDNEQRPGGGQGVRDKGPRSGSLRRPAGLYV